MRKFLRKWLGIDDDRMCILTFERVRTALEYIFSDDPVYPVFGFSEEETANRIRGRIAGYVAEIADAGVAQAEIDCVRAANRAIEEVVGSEEFIDKVVARIRAKQLPGGE